MSKDPAHSDAIEALAALAHDTRLSIFRLLVQTGPAGLSAGDIAEAQAMPASSLSFHLAHLRRAGLVRQRRQGRQLIYAADFATMNGLVGYLTENCCGGSCRPASPPPLQENAHETAARARRR